MVSIGIDLGTTTSLLAKADSDLDNDFIEVEIVETPQRIRQGEVFHEAQYSILPSFAYFADGDSPPTVGHEAKEATHLGAEALERCVRAVKRHMGRSIVLPAPVNKTPAQVASLYLAFLLGYADEKGLFTSRSELTITVPASFTSKQRRDTEAALSLAADALGIELPPKSLKRVLISEPVAALLAYLAEDLRNAEDNRQLDLDKNPTVLVYDIGGGTLDLTLVQLSWRNRTHPKTISNVRFEILQLNRYNRFGGEDFDLRVGEFLLEQLLVVHPDLATANLTEKECKVVAFDLEEEAERLKILLNDEYAWSKETAEVSFTYDVKLRNHVYTVSDFPVSMAQYLQWIEPFFKFREDQKNVFYPIRALLEKAKLRLADVDHFLLVGGMARFEPLKEALQAEWGARSGFVMYPSPDYAVARGAAVYSEMKTNYKEFVIDEPAADAYYVRKANGFELLLGRGSHDEGEKREFHLTATGDRLRMQLFAGEEPEAAQPVSSIYPTMVYQGRTVIRLGKEYPKDTPVWIQMYRPEGEDSKLPSIRLWVQQENNLVLDQSFSDFED